MAFRNIVLFSLVFIINCNCFPQETTTVFGDYTYYTTESTSIEEAKRIALERAKIQAIADTFGTHITQSTSTSITSKNDQSETRFLMYGTSDIKGEWLETLKAPVYSIKFESPLLIVNCKVTGRIREILQQDIEFDIKLLKNGLTSNFESNDFKDGDDLYLQFKSSDNGNIMIYLMQNNTAYRLLPYKRSSHGEYPIIGGRDYVFFSKATERDNDMMVDEYKLFSDHLIDTADILIIYTPNSIGGPQVENQIYDEPLSIDADTFNKWILKKRNKDHHSRVIIKPLTIKKS